MERYKTVLTGTIEDIGDLSITSGRTIIKAENLVVTPGLIIKSDESPGELLKMGITTIVKTDDPVAEKIESFPKDGTVISDKISQYSAEPAKVLNMDQKGIIDIDMIADLLVFESKDHDILSLKDLKYVIKNGKIVFKYE